MVFDQHPKAHIWRLNNHSIQQVNPGVLFHATGNGKFNADYVALNVQNPVLESSFNCSKGAQHILTAFEVFLAKI